MPRKLIDWDLIQRLFIANQLTIRQIAKECGVSDAAIRKRAKANGWVRDLSGPIKARTQAKIAMAEVAAIASLAAQEKVAARSAELTAEAIEHASDIAAGIVVRHRSDLKKHVERSNVIGERLDTMIQEASGLKDMAIITQCFKSLVEAQSRIIALEREAFGLDDKDVSDESDEFAHLSEDALLSIAQELAEKIGLFEGIAMT